jgi:hypothetical protein
MSCKSNGTAINKAAEMTVLRISSPLLYAELAEYPFYVRGVLATFVNIKIGSVVAFYLTALKFAKVEKKTCRL